MYTTNWGLQYLSYTTRIIFKAAKPVPTMLLEWLYVGKRFSRVEVFNVAILTFGITMFSCGEARDAPTFHFYGVVLMVLGIFFDSWTSNYEKKDVFSYNASHCEAMFFASLLGTLWTVGTLVLTDFNMLFDAIYFCTQQPLVMCNVFFLINITNK
ncbi:DMT family transporter: UDP-galactose [Reticulomyxa filosa]|uniref:DMT family transporter: UDP-galactose n=1 Tax=Reticulomyxa filosa TaxID=46433 RepID=X6NVC2_RETFI|nr:DMT family transporter: UDP-galactose [Reticulomyxa filosa]|eukprot:ETO29232.1 DMT family transporter: UDP-galactose [Reticulomyxa filosa]